MTSRSYLATTLRTDGNRYDRPVTKRAPRRSPRIDERVAERVADTMFALSTPSRVQILGCLLAGPHAVSDLMDALGMEQSAVSHQLRVLREHTLVKAERAGRKRVYALHDEHVVAFLEDALRHVEQRDKRGRRSRIKPPIGGAAEAAE
jgi:DNA-binding transcriptional ArsR family regulator